MQSVRNNLSIVPLMEWAVMEVSLSSRALLFLEMLYLTALSRRMNLGKFQLQHTYQRPISVRNRVLTSALDVSSPSFSVARKHFPL